MEHLILGVIGMMIIFTMVLLDLAVSLMVCLHKTGLKKTG